MGWRGIPDQQQVQIERKSVLQNLHNQKPNLTFAKPTKQLNTMKVTEQQKMHWADLMHQLEHNTTFSKRQFHSIGYVVASLKATTEKKISIIEEVIKLNVKKENNEN